MLSPEDQARIPGWNAHKNGQWERIAFAMPGLQLVRSGERQSTFMLVCSQTSGPDADGDGEPGFYEGVVIGRLPQIVIEHKEGRAGQRIAVPEHEKPLHKRGVDLKDEEIDQIIARWKTERSVLDLPFVTAVWGRDGRMRAAEG